MERIIMILVVSGICVFFLLFAYRQVNPSAFKDKAIIHPEQPERLSITHLRLDWYEVKIIKDLTTGIEYIVTPGGGITRMEAAK